MEKGISEVASRCLSLFKNIVTDEQKWAEAQVQLSSVQDELSRFKVWAGNMGAHRTGRSSLEYRLRDASHIKSQVLRLLESLRELLDDASAILRDVKIPWDKFPDEDVSSLADDASLSELSIPDTELGQILRNVTDINSCLVRLSVSIRNPAPHDSFRASRHTDTTHFEPYDIEHVRSKFPSMDHVISERLGRAISRRRQFFKYRQSHHDIISQGLDFDTNATEIIPQSTIASSIPEHLKNDTAFDLMATNDDAASETRFSLTSYATSTAGEDKLRVPPLPTEAELGPFECPFCYMVIIADSRLAWKRHVFQDLRPYVCLSTDCEAPEQDFDSRHQWMDHILNSHWKIWRCPSGCQITFDSAAGCRDHLVNNHSDAFPSWQIDSIIKLCEATTTPERGLSCPFCGHSINSIEQYQRHVGNHEVQIALFALPSLGKDETIEEREEERERGADTSIISPAPFPSQDLFTPPRETLRPSKPPIILSISMQTKKCFGSF
ncbi:hypothetical protein F5X98DRAFT_366486 [Xylaria grammica]|nr:hypothetical protein F5X98DRAFT_366486 [Xylaria grammica]